MNEHEFKTLFLKMLIPNIVMSISSIVFVVALIDYFVVSATLFAAPGSVMAWTVLIAVVCFLIMGVTFYRFIFNGDKSPRRNKWQ